VFAQRDNSELGRADSEDNRIWLSEQLFLPGEQSRLAMTYLHELAHVMSGEKDATRAFEYALTEMLGRLAMRLLEPAP
jgi:hypothetical protein